MTKLHKALKNFKPQDIMSKDKELNKILSLYFWINDVIKKDSGKKKIPFIPAIFSEPFPGGKAVELIDRPGDKKVFEIFKKFKNIINKMPEPVFRWDQKSTSTLKYLMSKGTLEYDKRMGGIEVDDPGIVDIIIEHITRLVARPYFKPYGIGTHPLEFRVFINDENKIDGISYYYPQNLEFPKELTDDVFRSAKESIEMTEKILKIRKFKYGCTLDFICCLDPNKREYVTMFLEGGPPVIRWAHPCCFEPFINKKSDKPNMGVNGFATPHGLYYDLKPRAKPNILAPKNNIDYDIFKM